MILNVCLDFFWGIKLPVGRKMGHLASGIGVERNGTRRTFRRNS